MSASNFAREWTRAQQSVLAFIGSLVVDHANAEDLLQETASQAFAQMERYDATRPFLPWVLGVARYVVLEHRRTSARDRHIFDDEIVAQLAEAFEAISNRNDRVYRALAVCRERLSPRSKFVCRLRYEKDLPLLEIAGQLGESVGSVRALLHRARQQLRACIEQALRAEGAAT
jgi:RNA polymerase sigma-70 factor (ECF subfamily)